MKRAGTLALLVLLLAGCNGEDDGSASGRLAWVGKPRLVEPEGLPRDRILTGTVRNDSLERVTLQGSELRAVASGGGELRTAAIFARGFAHTNFPTNRGEVKTPESEQIRIGLKAVLEPGEKAPLTVSWRGRAARIDYGTGSLPVPARR